MCHWKIDGKIVESRNLTQIELKVLNQIQCLWLSPVSPDVVNFNSSRVKHHKNESENQSLRQQVMDVIILDDETRLTRVELNGLDIVNLFN